MQPLSLAAGGEKVLSYTVHNAQPHKVSLHCNTFHLTGERISSFARDVMPGKMQSLATHNLHKSCNGGVVVKCKLKKQKEGYGIAYFWMTVPCEQIKNTRSLELLVSKENEISGYYP